MCARRAAGVESSEVTASGVSSEVWGVAVDEVPEVDEEDFLVSLMVVVPEGVPRRAGTLCIAGNLCGNWSVEGSRKVGPLRGPDIKHHTEFWFPKGSTVFEYKYLVVDGSKCLWESRKANRVVELMPNNHFYTVVDVFDGT
mmetsp:Transcript_13131/g.33304  ORF Transcript_13131/g.33304 Transcript_13131/m.33304 type:complete len:141 (+) Transcript_13131:3-425(+)